MQPFRLSRPTRVEDAVAIVSRENNAAFIAGGTTLINQMNSGERADLTHLVDISALPLTGFEIRNDVVRIGALERGSTQNQQIRVRYPIMVEALLSGASPQIRNMATLGGNLLQGTRGPFFNEPNGQMLANHPDGYRWGPIFGVQDNYPRTHGSDLAVALTALDAVIIVQGSKGQRRIPINDFYLIPNLTQKREHTLNKGELITAIELPAAPFAQRSMYLKVRDRASFAYMVISVGAALELRDGVVRSARIALGGVAPRPWRSLAAERALVGQRLNATSIQVAARASVQGARALPENRFKIELVQRIVTRALTELGASK